MCGHRPLKDSFLLLPRGVSPTPITWERRALQQVLISIGPTHMREFAHGVLYPAHPSLQEHSFPSSSFNAVVMAAGNQPWWEKLHHRNQQALQTRAFVYLFFLESQLLNISPSKLLPRTFNTSRQIDKVWFQASSLSLLLKLFLESSYHPYSKGIQGFSGSLHTCVHIHTHTWSCQDCSLPLRLN